MRNLKDELSEAEELESKILDLFEGKSDYILMSALTMVTARVILYQKRHFPTMDVERVLAMADEQLRYAVNGVLGLSRKGSSGH